ncbi:MAG: type II toxin-antitoxin system RelE/ParE family toxin [Planctomycetota bacterium]
MKTYRIIPEPNVEIELEAIYQWIAESSPLNAIRWYNNCLSSIASLSELPQRCSIAPESESFGCEVRQLLHGQYRIPFTIREQAVHVLHVRHGARAALDDTLTE